MTTLVFMSADDVLSRLIRVLTKGRTSHVAIGERLFGVPILIHATVGGVQVSHRAKWIRGHTVVAEYAFETGLKVDLAGAVALMGERYDYVGLLGFIPVLVARWFGRKIKNPLASARATVCSELVLRADFMHAIKEWRGLDPERTSPEDLLEICERSESFARCVI